VLETNYDNCIERSAYPESIKVAINDVDRADMDNGALLKVHGCATKPESMLVTSADLHSPPLFASSELAARLSSGLVLFVGIGSPADYVRASLDHLLHEIGPQGLTVVDPRIDDWSTSSWAPVIPSLPLENRIASDAESFCDALIRAYIVVLFPRMSALVNGLPPGHGQRAGVERMLAALSATNGVRALRWLRTSTWKFGIGRAAVDSEQVVHGLLALGALIGNDGCISLKHAAWAEVRASGQAAWITMLLAGAAPLGTEVSLEASRRVSDARADDRIPPGLSVIVLCTGQSGPLGSDEIIVERGYRLIDVLKSIHTLNDALPENLIDDPDPSHLIDSAIAGGVTLVNVERLIEAA